MSIKCKTTHFHCQLVSILWISLKKTLKFTSHLFIVDLTKKFENVQLKLCIYLRSSFKQQGVCAEDTQIKSKTLIYWFVLIIIKTYWFKFLQTNICPNKLLCVH